MRFGYALGRCWKKVQLRELLHCDRVIECGTILGA